MDIEDIDKILTKYYDKIDILKENIDVARCEKHYRGIPYQIFYFDYSQNWLKDNFDLEKYLEELLTDNYYSNSGFLQWNFYVVFLHNSKGPTEEKKAIIEKNEEFARKYVINYELLDDWLDKKYRIKIDISSSISQDLSLLWINKLKSNDLECVYSKKISYAKGLDSYIEGKPFKEPNDLEDLNQLTTINHEKLTAIKKIILTKYREYPIKKEFDFGNKINLIFGQNGSGKTSLLEAIEVFLCGKNFRNPDDIDSSIIMKVLYDNKHDFENIDLLNTKKYKSRDTYWYNNPSKQRGNNLYLGFKRFNFYNSDAAFQFSNEGSSEELKKAFVDIALGENVNYIEERLNGYYDRFEKELRKYDSSITDHKEIIARENDTLNEITKVNKNPELLFDKFISGVKNLGWKGDLPQSINDSYATFEKDYNKIKFCLDQALESLNWLENLTINSLLAEKSKLEELKINIIDINKKINEENNKLTEYKNKLNHLNEILKALNRLKIYLSAGIELTGLDEKINNLRLRELKYKEAINITETVDLSPFKDSEYNLEEYKYRFEKEVQEKISKKSKLTIEINKLEKSLSKLENIIIEVKSKGREFLDIAPEAQNCPLCNAYYNKEELISRIESSYNNIKDSKVLEDLFVERDKLIKELEYLDSKLNTLTNVEKAFLIIEFSDRSLKYPLYTLNKTFGHFREEYLKIQEELRKISIQKDDLDFKGLTEKEFLDLKKKVAEKGIGIDDIKPDDLMKIITKYEEEYKKYKYCCKESDNIIMQLYNLKKTRLNNYFNQIYSDDFEILVHNRIEKISSSIKLLENSGDVITIPSNTSINEIKINAESFYKLFEKFKNEKNEKDRIDIVVMKSKKNIDLYKEKIELINKDKKRIEKALHTIGDILKKNSKEKYLQSFLNENKKEIVRIFNAIHSPKEFEDIYFDNSDITLKRINSSVSAKLSTISTGQRSALALSVFLCLNNKLKNGPPYLIFDDPISFVDDLNLLSFIDYLREIAINTEKQIFFATANKNLAFLFSQKLKFIGDSEFKTYTLTR